MLGYEPDIEEPDADADADADGAKAAFLRFDKTASITERPTAETVITGTEIATIAAEPAPLVACSCANTEVEINRPHAIAAKMFFIRVYQLLFVIKSLSNS